MSHTQGPWRLGGVKELLLNNKCREIVADDGRIGLVYGITDEDCKANAELIADAPRMLGVIRKLREFVEPTTESYKAFSEAVSLLKKHGG